jgi:acyl-CoA thioester hydrolase
MGEFVGRITFRIRYSETDRMGGFYNSRALEWFEMGRNEYLREVGVSYADMEDRGYRLPVIEAHVEFKARATYDDLLAMETRASMVSRLRVRFENELTDAATGTLVAQGYTVHVVADPSGKPVRPPPWLTDALRKVAEGG